MTTYYVTFLYLFNFNMYMKHNNKNRKVYGLATGWAFRGSNLGAGEIFRTLPDWLWLSSNFLHKGYCVIPGNKTPGAWR